MVTFGGTSLPNVLSVQITDAHDEIERVVPYRTTAYHADKAQLGRTVQVSGEIRETTLDILASDIEQLRSLNDGTARSLDLQDGTAAFNSQLTDPTYELAAENWFCNADMASGRFTVPYQITFLEVS
jgi:CHAD domain-containing protein